MSDTIPCQRLGRRAFLHQGTLLLVAAPVVSLPLLAAQSPPVLRFGLVTDLHFADKPPAGTRHYRETPQKLGEAAEQFRQNSLDFLVELGDFIDAADSPAVELQYLNRINLDFAAIARDRHYVLGNHCVETLTKAEFLETVEQPKSFYSFDRANVHFVVLDACFRSDGQPYGRKNSQWDDANVPQEELDWLTADLAATSHETIVFVHQRLDVATRHGVRNAAAVRKILEGSHKVRAVFQGHSHQNDLKEIAGIPYCTLVAMVEGSGADNSGYSIVSVDADRTIRLSGFRRQQPQTWKRR